MNLFSPKAVKGKYIVLKIIGGNNGEKKPTMYEAPIPYHR
jgi:hypothetical protein